MPYVSVTSRYDRPLMTVVGNSYHHHHHHHHGNWRAPPKQSVAAAITTAAAATGDDVHVHHQLDDHRHDSRRHDQPGDNANNNKTSSQSLANVHHHRQRFEVLRKLGSGTYGKVSLAIDHSTGQKVAVKIIRKSAIESHQDLLRIRREIRIMSALKHPNIIEIKEVFENAEKIIIVMENASGGELYDYLNNGGPLTENEVRRIFRQIVSAVYYCHKHGVAHRDLKLENILLDDQMNAKIADFGLSNYFNGTTLLHTFCGSPLYASPEIINGIPYKGPEVDCWSLGVLLYSLAYSSMPFDGRDFSRMIRQIKRGVYYEPEPPSTASMLIRIMLRVNADRRATIDEIADHWWLNFDQENEPIKDLPENQIVKEEAINEQNDSVTVQAFGDEDEIFSDAFGYSNGARRRLDEFRRRWREVEQIADEPMHILPTVSEPPGTQPSSEAKLTATITPTTTVTTLTRTPALAATTETVKIEKPKVTQPAVTLTEPFPAASGAAAVEEQVSDALTMAAEPPLAVSEEVGQEEETKAGASEESDLSGISGVLEFEMVNNPLARLRALEYELSAIGRNLKEEKDEAVGARTGAGFGVGAAAALSLAPTPVSFGATAVENVANVQATSTPNAEVLAGAKETIPTPQPPQPTVTKARNQKQLDAMVNETNRLMNELLEQSCKGKISQELVARIRQTPGFREIDSVREIVESIVNAHAPPPQQPKPSQPAVNQEVNQTPTKRMSITLKTQSLDAAEYEEDRLPDVVKNKKAERSVVPSVTVMDLDDKPDVITGPLSQEVAKFLTEPMAEKGAAPLAIPEEHTEEEQEEEVTEPREGPFAEEEVQSTSFDEFEDLASSREMNTAAENSANDSFASARSHLQDNSQQNLSLSVSPQDTSMASGPPSFTRGLSKRVSRGKYEKIKFIFDREIAIESSPTLPRKRVGRTPLVEEAPALFDKAKKYILQYPDELSATDTELATMVAAGGVAGTKRQAATGTKTAAPVSDLLNEKTKGLDDEEEEDEEEDDEIEVEDVDYIDDGSLDDEMSITPVNSPEEVHEEEAGSPRTPKFYKVLWPRSSITPSSDDQSQQQSPSSASLFTTETSIAVAPAVDLVLSSKEMCLLATGSVFAPSIQTASAVSTVHVAPPRQVSLSPRDRWTTVEGGRGKRKKEPNSTSAATVVAAAVASTTTSSTATNTTKLKPETAAAADRQSDDKSKQRAYFRRAVTTAFEEIFRNRAAAGAGGGQTAAEASLAAAQRRNDVTQERRRGVSIGAITKEQYPKRGGHQQGPQTGLGDQVPSSAAGYQKAPRSTAVATGVTVVHQEHEDDDNNDVDGNEHSDYRRSSYRTAIHNNRQQRPQQTQDPALDGHRSSTSKELASTGETAVPGGDSLYSYYNASRGGARSYVRPSYNSELYWSYLNRPVKTTHILYPIGERSSSFHLDGDGVNTESGDSPVVRNNHQARVNARNRKAKSWYETDAGDMMPVELDGRPDGDHGISIGVTSRDAKGRLRSPNLNHYRYPRFDDNITYRRSVYDVGDDDTATTISARTFRPTTDASGLLNKRAQSVERYLNHVGTGRGYDYPSAVDAHSTYRATSMPAYVAPSHHFPAADATDAHSVVSDTVTNSRTPAVMMSATASPTDRKMVFDYSSSASKYGGNSTGPTSREDGFQNKDQGRPLTLVDKIRRRIVQDRYVPSPGAYSRQSAPAVDDYQPDLKKSSYLFGKYSKWTPSSSTYPPGSGRADDAGSSRVSVESVSDKPKKKKNIWQQLGRRKTADILPSSYNTPSASSMTNNSTPTVDDDQYLKRSNSPIGKIKGFFSNCTTWRSPTDDKSSSSGVNYRPTTGATATSATTGNYQPHDSGMSSSYGVNSKPSYNSFYRKAPRPLSYVPPVRHRYDESNFY